MDLKFMYGKEKLTQIIKNLENWHVENDVKGISLRITTPNNTIFNYWESTGKITVQGKSNEEDIKLFNKLIKNDIPLITEEFLDTNKNRIYIVHGHDTAVKNELENILFKWGLQPVSSIEQPANGLTIIEGVIKDLETVSYGIVLLTPDDFGYAKIDGDNPNPKPRARQNVILEMGMLISKLGRENVAILRKNEIEQPSDTDGLIYISFADTIANSNAKDALRKKLISAGIKIKE